MASPAASPKSRSTERRLLAIGIGAGLYLGYQAINRLKPASPPAATETSGTIDWDQARNLAVTMNRGEAMTSIERARLTAQYRALAAKCIPIVADYTGDTLPETLERTYAFDRVDWIHANIDGFREMLAPLESLSLLTSATSSGAVLGGLNRKLVSGEIGLLLGYLARRVLGQYDLALLGKEPVATGKLYYVEPNIRMVEAQLGLPADDFRMWLALHETTHAFEFETHPWLRDHFNQLLGRYFTLLNEDADSIRQAGWKGLTVFIDRARTTNSGGDGGWMEALMTPEQRALFGELQAMMCMVEGYSNHVMNAVGSKLLPSYGMISRKFQLRQQQRGPGEELFARLTGLTVKLEQYRLGEAFINTIARERGHEIAKRIWDGPEFLPTMEEIRDPARWLARIDARDAARTRQTAGTGLGE